MSELQKISVKALLIALQLLTRIPLPFAVDYRDRELGRSTLYYPLVGLILGAVLVLDGAILGRGHNRRVQDGDPSVHGETAAFKAAGRLGARGLGEARVKGEGTCGA